jgi:hypothetical protein
VAGFSGIGIFSLVGISFLGKDEGEAKTKGTSYIVFVKRKSKKKIIL